MKTTKIILMTLITLLFSAQVGVGFDSLAVGAGTFTVLMGTSLFIQMPEGSLYEFMGPVFSPSLGLDKLVAVNNNQGNGGMQLMQATTRVIYDSLVADARGTYRFFENVGSRQFPRTNMSENKLQVGESLIIKWINMHVVTYSTALALPVVSIEPLSTTFAGTYRSDLSIVSGNVEVLKPTPLDSQFPNFNRHANHTLHESMRLETNIILPSLLEFIVYVRTTNATVSTTKEFMLEIEGASTIFAPNKTF